MITIQFDFRHRREEDLQQLNKLLQTMELTELNLEDTEGYLATTTDPHGNIIHRRYGLDSGTLRCELANYRPGYHYQIDTYVVNRAVDHDTYLQNWRQLHPDRAMRISITVGFDDVLAYTIVHHEKVVKDHE